MTSPRRAFYRRATGAEQSRGSCQSSLGSFACSMISVGSGSFRCVQLEAQLLSHRIAKSHTDARIRVPGFVPEDEKGDHLHRARKADGRVAVPVGARAGSQNTDSGQRKRPPPARLCRSSGQDKKFAARYRFARLQWEGLASGVHNLSVIHAQGPREGTRSRAPGARGPRRQRRATRRASPR